jgi:hypothetical protein
MITENKSVQPISKIIDDINKTYFKIKDVASYLSLITVEILDKFGKEPSNFDLLLHLEETNISRLKMILNVSDKSIVVFVYLFEKSFKKERVSLFDLSKKCGGYSSLHDWMPYIKELLCAGLIIKHYHHYSDELTFKIPQIILESILSDDFKKEEQQSNLTNMEFFKMIRKEFKKCERGKNVSIYDTFNIIKNIVKLNETIPVCDFLLNNQLDDEEIIYLLRTCYLRVFGNESSYISTLNELVNEIEDDSTLFINDSSMVLDFISFERTLNDKSSLLIKKSILQPRNNGVYRESGVFELTSFAISLFLNDVVIEGAQNPFNSPFYTIIEPEETTKIDLVYSPVNLKSLSSIENLLMIDNLFKSFDKAKSYGLNQKITVMLRSDGFGTGKSSWAKQLGKKTGRKVLMVNKSSLKSSYFSESEKNLQELFTSYNKMVEEIIRNTFETEDNKIPILFMDEISSLFVSRKNLSNGKNDSVTNTLHELSNIILTCLDNFKGILICTSNTFSKSGYELEEGLSRRFTIKLNIESPDELTRFEIIKLNLSEWIKEDEIRVLSRNYNLTGGQINVIKERLIADDILGNNIDFSLVKSYFEIEAYGWGNSINKQIGF